MAVDPSFLTPHAPRPFGLGCGLLVLILIAALLLLVCLFASKTENAWFIWLGSGALYGAVVAIALSLPRMPINGVVETPKLVDNGYYPRIAFATGMLTAAIAGGTGVVGFYVFQPVYAVRRDWDEKTG